MSLTTLLVVVALAQTPPLPPAAMPGFVPFTPTTTPRVAQPSAIFPSTTPVTANRVPDPADATAWAVQDLMLRSPDDRPFIRYLWVPPWGGVEWHQVNSFIVNSAISRSSTIVLPDSAAGGWLIVWDLRRLCPKPHDLKHLLCVWDALAIREPYFHALLPEGKFVVCPPYTHIDGKVYTQRIWIPAPHVLPGYGILEQETQCFAPLLRADHFLRRVSSTIEEGLYYHCVGFIRGGRRLNEKEIFKLVGLDITLSREVEGDDRAAVFQSAVTGKPRTIEQVQGALGKARITYDIFDEDVDANRHAIYHLLAIVDKSRGKEIIFELPNGLFGYMLTNGAGALVDVGPPNLVSDHRSPEPITKQLYPMLSCIRCHGPNRGIQKIRNDVPPLLAGGVTGDIDIFTDLSSHHPDRFATLDRLTGLFAANKKFQDELDLSRVRYGDAVWACTRGMGVTGDTNISTKTAEAFASQFAAYWYPESPTEGNVNADQACLEFGYQVDAEGGGAEFLQDLLKPGRVDAIIGGVAIEFGDPALAALRRNMSIRRQDFERIYPYGIYQVIAARSRQK